MGLLYEEGFEFRARAKGYSNIAGIDEAGRGPLAGPVVSAAVIWPEDSVAAGVNDSKQLSAKKRERLFDYIYEKAVSIGIGIVDPIEIDRINILQASLLSMRIAVENLQPKPDYLLIDGIHRINTDVAQEVIKGGDGRCLSVAAASIVAKVTRDRLMVRYDEDFPEFKFSQHKGYGTKVHCDAIRTFGRCRIHRKSFGGVN